MAIAKVHFIHALRREFSIIEVFKCFDFKSANEKNGKKKTDIAASSFAGHSSNIFHASICLAYTKSMKKF